MARGGLVSSSRTTQGHEHFSGPVSVLANVNSDDGVPTKEVILVTEPLEDVPSGVALLSVKLEILSEDAVDGPGFTAVVATAPSANLRPPG